MLKDLGESIAEIVKITPDGVLVFFPSYFLMDKCDKLWEKLTIIPKIERYKNYYVEPKQSSQFKRVRSKFEQDIESGRGALLMGV